MIKSFVSIVAALWFGVTAAQAQAQVASAKPSRGEYLARIGDCVACHSIAGGAAFAGGLAMGTPVGTIYSTNITPDREAGIGLYTLHDFDQALRHGVARDGHHLYPAMPYPSYAALSDADVRDLYDFFMHEVPPAQTPNRSSDIPALLSMRWPLAVWNFAFSPDSSFTPRKDQSEEWNRGAYLVEGLGHCGACHTPRGIGMQESAYHGSDDAFLSGAELDGWSAPSLRGEMRTGLGAWSQNDIVAFLKTGHNQFGAAFGSMTDVLNNSTPYMNEKDLTAIAAYLKSLPARQQEPAYVYDQSTTQQLRNGKPDENGASIYAANCSFCHGLDGKGQGVFMPALAGNPTVLDHRAASLINLVLNGAQPLVVGDVPSAYRMPQYRVQLDDQDIAAVVSFIRAAWGNHAAPVKAGDVAALRATTDAASDQVIVLKMR